GLPKLAVSAIQHLPQDLLSTMTALFVHGPAAPDRWLAGMPIFDLFLLAIVGGMAYGLHFWLRLFPLNPLGRSIGISLLAGLVLLSCLLNIRAYFVAWPQNPAVRQAYRLER